MKDVDLRICRGGTRDEAKTIKEKVEEIFTCYDETVTVHKRRSIEE